MATKTSRFFSLNTLLILVFAWLPMAWAGSGDHPPDGEAQQKDTHEQHGSRLSDEDIPLMVASVPDRPKPLLELGEPFLGTGTLSPGFQLPTGAVWQPSLLVFASLRTALQSNNFYSPSAGDVRTTEAVARLDLFANLQLSGSERLVLGFRNLDRDGRFTGYVFDSEDPAQEEDGSEELNADISSLFFEGDLGEVFPNISPRDFKGTDIGFSVGRQPLFFQEGMLINDTIDGIGLTWNSLQPRGTSNFRTTLFYGWNNVNRANIAVDSGKLLGLLTSIDFPVSTMDFDITFSEGGDLFEDMYAVGISAIQRIGLTNTSFRVLASFGEDLPESQKGYLLFSEISRTPHHTHNLLYINNFWAIDHFTSAARGPSSGGPLGRAGISFAGVGIGNYGAPLNAGTGDVAGTAAGYQMFFDATRKQLIIELAARVGTVSGVDDQYALTARYQMALGRRFAITLDGFLNHIETFSEDTFFGGRLELLVRL